MEFPQLLGDSHHSNRTFYVFIILYPECKKSGLSGGNPQKVGGTPQMRLLTSKWRQAIILKNDQREFLVRVGYSAPGPGRNFHDHTNRFIKTLMETYKQKKIRIEVLRFYYLFINRPLIPKQKSQYLALHGSNLVYL